MDGPGAARAERRACRRTHNDQTSQSSSVGMHHRVGRGVRLRRYFETPRSVGWTMGRAVRGLGLPSVRELCRRSVRNSWRRRRVDRQVEASRRGDPCRPHDWRVLHARRQGRVPAPHSAACPGRTRLAAVLSVFSKGCPFGVNGLRRTGYLTHLTDSGVLTVTRWASDGLRLVALAQDVCAAQSYQPNLRPTRTCRSLVDSRTSANPFRSRTVPSALSRGFDTWLLPPVPPGFTNHWSSRTLKTSILSCTVLLRGSLNSRNTPKSQFATPGPRTARHGAVPNRASVTGLNASGSNHGLPRPMPPRIWTSGLTWSARWLLPGAFNDVSLAVMLNGVPL